MYPTRETAEALLREAETMNPGIWADHCRVAARCAERIAARCSGLDADKAYVLGLLHDVGRKVGVCQLRHVYAGWKTMTALGYDEAARICLTHSFDFLRLDDYLGVTDISPDEADELACALAAIQLNEYDLLIQLCDGIAGAEGVVNAEVRMLDIKRRYGRYPAEKWANTLALIEHFEQRMGCGLYDAVMTPEECTGLAHK